jgi:indolepyruvate ferredoxin oxidoreductase
VQSNCMSVEPLETEFGRKRQINQSTCNKDFSCVKGFCPSFVTVEGGTLKKAAKPQAGEAQPASWPTLPEPLLPDVGSAPGGVWGTIVAGVGGTGVITIGQLLGVAAHLEGKGVVTQDAGGLAQKGGATWSHVLIGTSQDAIRTTRVGTASADLVLGCDPIVVAGKETLVRMRPGRTHVALNSNSAPTAAFVKNANWTNPGAQCVADIAKTVGEDCMGVFDADAAATQLLGDSIYTNPMMLGFAWQKGWIPLQWASLMRAIELNAVAVANNKAAFEWGRRAAVDWPAVQRALNPGQVIAFAPRKTSSLDELVDKRVAYLTAYQNAAYAQQYADVVAQVRVKEAGLGGDKLPLSEAVARYLFKLMAYKDEYEVARLHTDTAFLAKVQGMFEGDFRLNYHLAPPLLAKKNAQGELQKIRVGRGMQLAFRLLAPLKVLRGGPLDVFGYTQERREERALVDEYRAALASILPLLTVHNRDAAAAFARVPEHIRGYGHVKARHLVAARLQWAERLAEFHAPKPAQSAREAVHAA